jgi:hypothetical protein
LLALLVLTLPACEPEVPLFSGPSGGPPTTTITGAGSLFGRGFHRGNCNTFANQLQPRFTTRAAGRAVVTLTFTPIPGQELSLTLDPAPAGGDTRQGPGPTLEGSFAVRGGVEYAVRICVPVGPGLDPGPFAASVVVTHP